MVSVIAAALLAAAVPSDKLASVAVAAYWYRKDSRGRGDSISERGVPKRFPAFAIGPDTFLVSDPLVRTQHLDRVEIWFRGAKTSAQEIARTENPDAVVLKSGRALPGVVPLEFADGEPVERQIWFWSNDSLKVKSAGVGTNDFVDVLSDGGRAFRRGEGNSLYLDAKRRPVGLDFGAREAVEGGLYRPVPPVQWTRVPADAYEKAVSAVERRAAAAALGVVLRLEPEEKEGRRGLFSFGSDDSGKNEIDALGLAIGDKILVPSDLDGQKIARLTKAEAVFPDGSVTNLVFAGAVAEWSAMVFEVPEPFRKKLEPLQLAAEAAADFDNRVAWPVSVENENGRVVSESVRRRFDGVAFIRGANFVPRVARGPWEDDYRKSSGVSHHFVLDDGGRIAVFSLSRRFKAERWSNPLEPVSFAEMTRILAGECFNPEFVPRSQDDRNRLVWLGAETVRLTDALARERKAQSFMGNYSRPPYVTEIYPGSPAEKSGLRVGDVLLAVRRGSEAERELEAESDYYTRDWGMFFESDSPYLPDVTPWPEVESPLNKLMTTYGAGAKVTLIYARDGQRREVTIWLEEAPVHYRNAVKARNRTLGLSVRDLTFEVRRYFKFDETSPGVVIAKVKPGSPAAVAGLRPFELVTEVNGEKVTGAKDFAAKIKGKRDLVFSVRRLAQTRIVKIHVEPEKEKGK